jgi:DNA-binding PadR family transcriptional regulator
MSSQRQPEELLPLTTAKLQILLALFDHEQHGFGLMDMIKQNTNGQVKLGPATMYRSLEALKQDGLITETEQPNPTGNSRGHYYRITDFGRLVAQAEVYRMAKMADQAALMALPESDPSAQPSPENVPGPATSQKSDDRWLGLRRLIMKPDNQA